MAERPVIVLGAGGHAKVVVDLLLQLGRTVIAAVESRQSSSGRSLLGAPVKDESVVLDYSPNDLDLALGVGMPSHEPIAGLSSRRALAQRFKSYGYRFPALVHPSASIGRETKLGEGVQIMAGAVVQPCCTVGDFAIVNTRAGVDHDCVLSEGCHIAPGVTLGGAVRVGAETLVGIGATVRQGISIGQHVLIAGGAMVAENVPDHEQRLGVPARRRLS